MIAANPFPFVLCADPQRVDYIATMLSIATFCLSVAVVCVAWAQWRVARNKLRLDLFDRRYKVYEATRTFLHLSIAEHSKIDWHLSNFKNATAHAEFLFGSDVVNYLGKIRKWGEEDDAISLSDPVRITEMSNAFAPYLGFANIKT